MTVADLPQGEPTIDDLVKARMWTQAKTDNADIWRLLTDDQKTAVEKRIAWATGKT